MAQFVMHIIASARSNQAGENFADHTGILNAEYAKRIHIKHNGASNRLCQTGYVGHLNTQEIAHTLQLVQ